MEQLEEYLNMHKKRKTRSLIVLTIAFLIGITAVSVASVWSAWQRQNFLKARLEAIQAQGELNRYNIRRNLLFPENDQANPLTANVEAYIRTEGGTAEKPYKRVRVEKGVGGIVVYVDFDAAPRLGDRLYVIVDDGGKKWRSDEMIASPPLKMKRIDHAKIQED